MIPLLTLIHRIKKRKSHQKNRDTVDTQMIQSGPPCWGCTRRHASPEWPLENHLCKWYLASCFIDVPWVVQAGASLIDQPRDPAEPKLTRENNASYARVTHIYYI